MADSPDVSSHLKRPGAATNSHIPAAAITGEARILAELYWGGGTS